MMNFFRSLYGKISIIFLTLLAVLAVLQVWITSEAFMQFSLESDQKLNANLAQSIAAEFEPFLQDSIHYADIEHAMHYLMVMNPGVEIYLLDSTGTIMTFFAEPRKKVKQDAVALEPIRRFLHENQQQPILGDDPKSIGNQKIFSVAPAQIGPMTKGYIYVILAGEEVDSVGDMIRESYILRLAGLVLLSVFAAAGIVGLLAFFMLTRRFRMMTEQVREFEKGRYHVRNAISSRDEIGQLAQAFNQMADTIVGNMQELQKTDELRRELVANISHDLRSPLASILGYLETVLMKDERLSRQERQKYLNIIYDNGKQLNHLVGELFELSKLDAQQIEPVIEHFAMAELTQDVVLKFKPLAEKLSVSFETSFQENLPQVRGDISLIERALNNLLDNAVRYTPKGGVVMVKLRSADRRVLVSISNTGEGIPADELPRIFERFYRTDKSRAKGSGGSGLGLAIANKILELHHSCIHVESVINEQTTFSFELPVEHA